MNGSREDKPFDLAAYLNQGAEGLVRVILRGAGLRYSLAFQKVRRIRERLEARGERVPAFLIGSITTRCNLTCAGCYSRANEARSEGTRVELLSAQRWGELFREARDCGIAFILLAGGEPLMRMEVLEEAARVKEILFPIFTNGILLRDRALELLKIHRNLIPMLSLEGGREETDGRRSEGTFDSVMAAMDRLSDRKLYFGVSITVTTDNLMAVTSPEFQQRLHSKGCKAVLFVEYVPMTTDTEPLAPTDKERRILAAEQSRLRLLYPDILFLSFPGDEQEAGGCLAAGRGFFHIGADGSAEPCPFSPYSDTNLSTTSLREALASPLFRHLEGTGLLSSGHSGGCLLVQKEPEVKAFLGL